MSATASSVPHPTVDASLIGPTTNRNASSSAPPKPADRHDSHPHHHRKRSVPGFWVRTAPWILESAEDRMLRTILPLIHRRFVAGINTISSVADEQPAPRPFDSRKHIVLIHGFGGGLTNFVPTWEPLVRAGGVDAVVHAIDLPGFARSSRLDPKTNKAPKFSSPDSVLDFYSECLMEWFAAMGLADTSTTPPTPTAHIVVGGHSFGGYLSAGFAVRNPSFLHHLILIDPWGLAPRNTEREKAYGWKASVVLFALRNIDGPLAILRWAGPCGTGLLPRFRPDFHRRWEALIGDGSAFNEYTYHCNVVKPPTGERAFQACCDGIGATVPLLHLLPQNFDSLNKLKISIMYGEDTWMPVGKGMRIVRSAMLHRRANAELNGFWRPASPATNSVLDSEIKQPLENGTDGFGVSIDYIAGAGHQVMADNPVGFNEALIQRIFNWKA